MYYSPPDMYISDSPTAAMLYSYG